MVYHQQEGNQNGGNSKQGKQKRGNVDQNNKKQSGIPGQLGKVRNQARSQTQMTMTMSNSWYIISPMLMTRLSLTHLVL